MFLIFSFLADIGSYLLPGVHIVLVSNAAQICRTLGEVSDRDVSNSASPSALRGIPGCQWPSDIFEEPTIITAINPGDNWIPYGIFVWKSDSTPILGTFTSATFFWCEVFFWKRKLRQQPDSCNYSCSSWRGYRTNEMNFRVSLTLNDSMLAKGIRLVRLAGTRFAIFIHIDIPRSNKLSFLLTMRAISLAQHNLTHISWQAMCTRCTLFCWPQRTSMIGG